VAPESPRPPLRRADRARATLAALSLAAALALPAPAGAADQTTVSSCPGQPQIPVTFSVDCSHLSAAADKAACPTFIENQACKVSPAYRKITGINLADQCRTVSYTLYDKEQWPDQGGDAGGHASHCTASLLAEFSVRIKSSVGPYDVHELLHIYQDPLGALPIAHILFGPTQLEARREIGDAMGFEKGFANLKHEALDTDLDAQYASGRLKAESRCGLAEVIYSERLYVANTKSVYDFYRKLVRGTLRDPADREGRFNRMFDAVSEGRARAFLTQHGCGPY
jgi:hypothetical protein